jgi:hypothetical protein
MMNALHQHNGPYHNTVAERVNGTLKLEFNLDGI